ncbi:RsmB/NOP family class I SAM-dependent RNA methyltransferase [Candidatus Nomurabacteria bacterium]|nr:RsmB/NOP family class I SAM-dependent RNA methyltransferase [Candidatus Nomurabacteria bacterium]
MAKKKKKKKVLGKNLPEKFLERTEIIVGKSKFEMVRKTFVDKPTTFRVNTLKSSIEEVQRLLAEKGFKVKQVPWLKGAYILQNRSKRELTTADFYLEGKIYVQSLASMVPPLVLDPQPGEKVLDLTAAPGSKTSQMAGMMQKKGELVANDLNKVRFFRLKANMELLGVDIPADDWEFSLRMEDGSALAQEYPEYFDKVLLDVPCSGEARFIEGYPKSYGYWSEKKIKNLEYRQHKILMAGWSALAPGGYLVYSTCTMAPEENEMRISKLLERVGEHAKVVEVKVSGLKTLSPIMHWRERDLHPDVAKTLRILPTMEVEGFYTAKIQKLA